MEILVGSILTFLKMHYGDVSISILTVAILTFYYKTVKPFLNAMPNIEDFENNKRHVDSKAKEILENMALIKRSVDSLKRDIESVENNASDGEKDFHNKMDNLMRDLNQISSKIETVLFLSARGEIK